MPGPEVDSGIGWLGSLRNLLVDMDGVLFRGDTVLPGATEFVGWLRSSSVGFRLLTNNSTATAEMNAARLMAIGIHVAPEEVLTSARATGLYLKEEGASGSTAYVVGETGIRMALEEAGVQVSESSTGVDWVVAGLDRHVTYQVLKEASLAIQRGARFVATNNDAGLPVEEGIAPGAGALQAAIVATTGVWPLVIGKPEGRMLRIAVEELRGAVSNTAMLGDRLDTDIEAARRAEMRSILVLTGVTSRAQLEASELQPTVVFDDLYQLVEAWDRAREK